MSLLKRLLGALYDKQRDLTLITISQMIYDCIGTIRYISTFKVIKILYEEKNKSGWATLTFEDFKKYGINAMTLSKALRELEQMGLLEIKDRKRNKNTGRGQVGRAYKLKLKKI